MTEPPFVPDHHPWQVVSGPVPAESGRYESRAELSAKIDWEGGMESALAYGIKARDLPAGDAELASAWLTMQARWEEFVTARDAVMRLLPDPGEWQG